MYTYICMLYIYIRWNGDQIKMAKGLEEPRGETSGMGISATSMSLSRYGSLGRCPRLTALEKIEMRFLKIQLSQAMTAPWAGLQLVILNPLYVYKTPLLQSWNLILRRYMERKWKRPIYTRTHTHTQTHQRPLPDGRAFPRGRQCTSSSWTASVSKPTDGRSPQQSMGGLISRFNFPEDEQF